MYSIVTPDSIRRWLKMSGEPQDVEKFLNGLSSAVTHHVKKYLMRDLLNQDYTELYDGYGDHEIVLDQYPVYDNGSNFTLYQDTNRDFAASSIIAAADYNLNTASGIITKHSGTFATGIKVIKVIYNAGVATEKIEAGLNDTFTIERSSTDYTITADAGTYTAQDFAAELQTQITAASIPGAAITVSYNPRLMLFRFTSTADFIVKFGLWDSANELMGFDSDVNYDAKLTGTDYEVFSSEQVVFMPRSITTACEMIVHHWYHESNQGNNLLMIDSQHQQGDTVTQYAKKGIPADAKELLDAYRREVAV